MSLDLRTLLDENASAPSRRVDASGIVRRARRQQRTRWAAACAVVGTALAASVAGVAALAPDDAGVLLAPGAEALPVPFDPAEAEAFANGETDGGVRWAAAARDGDPPCIGLVVRVREGMRSSAGCEPVTGVPVQATAYGAGQFGIRSLGVTGWVSEEVSRVVWERPDGRVELDIHERPGLPARVVAAFDDDPPAGPTALVALDRAGSRIGGSPLRLDAGDP